MAINAVEKAKSRPITLIGVALVLVGFLGPVLTGQAGVSAIIKIESTPPDINAMTPNGRKSQPSHFPPGTVTLKMNSLNEKVSNARCDVGGEIVNLSFDSVHQSHYGTEYWYTGSLHTSGHIDEMLRFTFKGDDDAGNTGSDTAYAIIGSYADGYFEIGPQQGFESNKQKIEKGATITLSSKAIHLEATVSTDVTPDSAWYTVEVKDVEGFREGKLLKSIRQTKKTSPPYSWNYTFPKDGTYVVNGYFRSYGRRIQVMSIDAGMNPPSPPTPIHWFYWMKIIGLPLLVAGVAIEPEIYR